ncbi:hypothetical protein [Actinoplanes sp. NPDC089786]|uniref:hypothetical protein n=1 Tax=Actinoplanes sp. NPDC089786 TaxID=3155185 RepID=UPI0034322233
MDQNHPHPTLDALPAGRVVCADSMGRALLAMAVPPAERRGGFLQRVPVLGRHGALPEPVRRAALTAKAVDEAVPLDRIDDIDAEAVADWIVSRYAAATYPAVVLGSPHGAAVHLAAACGAAWLPTTFTVTAPWPGGSVTDWAAAKAWGAGLAERILARNPGITVRQVHDPVLRGSLCGATVSMQVRWRTLPEAYQIFLRSRVAAGGASVLVRDLRDWPVSDGPPGYGFQVGTPTSGWTAEDYRPDSRALTKLLRSLGAEDPPSRNYESSRQYAETSGEPAIEPQLRRIAAETGSAGYRVLFRDPHGFSGAVADLYKVWLRPSAQARRAVVASGRMIDPWPVADDRKVPYWCESSSRQAAEAAEWWLAGSEPFDAVDVLPDPPGTLHDDTATLWHWRTIAAFGRRPGTVDALLAGRYPLLPPAAGRATRRLRADPPGEGQAGPLSVHQAVRWLKGNGPALGLLVI